MKPRRPIANRISRVNSRSLSLLIDFFFSSDSHRRTGGAGRVCAGGGLAHLPYLRGLGAGGRRFACQLKSNKSKLSEGNRCSSLCPPLLLLHHPHHHNGGRYSGTPSPAETHWSIRSMSDWCAESLPPLRLWNAAVPFTSVLFCHITPVTSLALRQDAGGGVKEINFKSLTSEGQFHQIMSLPCQDFPRYPVF